MYNLPLSQLASALIDFLNASSWMRCNHTDGMPRGDFNIYLASGRRGYVRAEEYVHVFHIGIQGSGMFPPPPTLCINVAIEIWQIPSLTYTTLGYMWHLRAKPKAFFIYSLWIVVWNRAVGIVLLVVVLAALLILGCWYFKKRSGYKIIRVWLFPVYFPGFLSLSL